MMPNSSWPELLLRLGIGLEAAITDLGRSQQAVERRADFVAHVGKEFALAASQLLGFPTGIFLHRDVGKTDDAADGFAIALHGAAGVADGEGAAIGPAQDVRAAGGLLGVDGYEQRAFLIATSRTVRRCRMEGAAHRFAEQGFHLGAEHGRPGPIDELDTAVPIHAEQTGSAGIQDQAHLGLGGLELRRAFHHQILQVGPVGLQFQLGPLALGNILLDGDEMAHIPCRIP